MDDIYIDVALRWAIGVGEKRLTYVNGKSIQNGKPALWPFGGGLATTDEGRQSLASNFSARDFQGDNDNPEDDPNDLRFWMPKSYLGDFEAWLKKQEKSLDFAKTAQSELEDECRRHGVPEDLVGEVKFCGVRRRIDDVRNGWDYQGREVRGAHCFEYIADARLSAEAVRMIEKLVASSDNLWLIGRNDVGKKIPGVVSGKPAKIEVPAMLRLLF